MNCDYCGREILPTDDWVQTGGPHGGSETEPLYGVHQTCHDAETLKLLRDVLKEGNWCEDCGGYEMAGGMWIEAETFEALFPDPSTRPYVERRDNPGERDAEHESDYWRNR